MKTRVLQLLSAFAFVGFSSAILAVQVSVEDVSNKVITCDPTSPFLVNSSRPGSCMVFPDGTLWVTATLEENDKPNVLDNIHVVVENNGQNFQYNTRSDISGRWPKASVNGLQGASPLVSSFQRFPFETNTVGRQVQLDQFYSQKGTKVYVGFRANDAAGFVKGSVKEAFEVR